MFRPEEDRLAFLQQVVAALGTLPGKVVAVSRGYRTPAFPAGAGPDFLNAALALETAGPPEVILSELHEIERIFGRERHERWGQRRLDLDLIAAGDIILPDAATQLEWCQLPLDRQVVEAPDQLVLPHPRLQDRAFVLVPLRDVAPDWRHPVSRLSVTEMCAQLPPREVADVVPLPESTCQ